MSKVVSAINLNTQYWIEGNLKKSELYENRPFNFEIVSAQDTNTSYTLILKFNKKGYFQVQGLANQWYQANDIVHGNRREFKITNINVNDS